MTEPFTTEALLEVARRHHRPGINADVALILGYAELAGAPLDPYGFDDAAVILAGGAAHPRRAVGCAGRRDRPAGVR